jgi:hypothetical protein
MLYKLGGSQKVDGKLVDYAVFEDVESAQLDGWLTHAQVWYSEESESRESLEAKATELGIKFDGRTTDAKLKKAIDELVKA